MTQSITSSASTTSLPAPTGGQPDRPAGPILPGESQAALTPAEAFDALYTRSAAALARQTFVLTGSAAIAQESVDRAFRLAWEKWPEVAVDPDPAGWVRTAAYDYALSPWRRLRPDPLPAGREAVPEAGLRNALLGLPPAYRRTLLLHDGLGIGLPLLAAETEASPAAAANRLQHAREAMAEQLSEQLSEPMDRTALRERLGALVGAAPVRVQEPPAAVRNGCEQRARLWARTAIGLTALIVSATGFTLATAPTHYERPQAPGEPVTGVPVPGGPQKLTVREKKLRDRLRAVPMHGPQRLRPEVQ